MKTVRLNQGSSGRNGSFGLCVLAPIAAPWSSNGREDTRTMGQKESKGKRMLQVW